jgi:hypothetical protein
MGKARDELIRQHGGTPWREKKAETWLEDSGVSISDDEHAQWLDDLAQRIKAENRPPLVLRLQRRKGQ